MVTESGWKRCGSSLYCSCNIFICLKLIKFLKKKVEVESSGGRGRGRVYLWALARAVEDGGRQGFCLSQDSEPKWGAEQTCLMSDGEVQALPEFRDYSRMKTLECHQTVTGEQPTAPRGNQLMGKPLSRAGVGFYRAIPPAASFSPRYGWLHRRCLVG